MRYGGLIYTKKKRKWYVIAWPKLNDSMIHPRYVIFFFC